MKPIVASAALAVAALLLPRAIGAENAASDDAIAIAVVQPHQVNFAQEISPILRASCVACHNAKTTKGKLNLETPRSIRAGGASGPAAVPGKPDESELLVRASHRGDDAPMPPPGNKAGARALTPEQLGLIKLWIEQGAGGDDTIKSAEVAWQALPSSYHPIEAIAVDPDGRIAACGRGNRIVVYDLIARRLVAELSDPPLADAQKKTQEEPYAYAHRDLVHSLVFSPDGDTLASGSYREVKLWRRSRPEVSGVIAAPMADSAPIAVDPSGLFLAVAGSDRAIRLYLLPEGKLMRTLVGHADAVTGLAFAERGARLCSVSSDKTIRSWPTDADGAPTVITAPSALTAIAVLGDGGIVTAGTDKIVRLWKDGAQVRQLGDAAETVTALAAAESGARFVAGTHEGSVSLWDATDGKVAQRCDAGGPVSAVALRPDGAEFAAIAAGKAHAWKAGVATELALAAGDGDALALIARRERDLAFARSEADYAAEVLKKATEQRTTAQQTLAAGPTDIAAAEQALTEAKAAVAAGKDPDAGEDLKQAEADCGVAKKAVADAEIALRQAEKDLTDGEASRKSAEARVANAERALAAARAAPAAAGAITALAFSRDGGELFAADEGGAIRTWGADTGLSGRTLPGRAKRLLALAAGRPGMLAAADADGLRVWDLCPPWKLAGAIGDLGESSPLASRVCALAFSPDGKLLATGSGIASRTGEVKIWNTATRELVRELADAHTDAVLGLDFSADGELIASCAADRVIRTFRVADGKPVQTLEGHADHVLGLSFSRDGRAIASCGADKTLRLWHAIHDPAAQVGGEPAQMSLPRQVTSVHHAGDGEDEVLITTGDGIVRIVDVPKSRTVRELAAKGPFIECSAITPDAAMVLAGDADGVLWLWDGAGRDPVRFEPPVVR